MAHLAAAQQLPLPWPARVKSKACTASASASALGRSITNPSTPRLDAHACYYDYNTRVDTTNTRPLCP